MGMFVDAFSKQVFDSKEALPAGRVRQSGEGALSAGRHGPRPAFIVTPFWWRTSKRHLHSYEIIIKPLSIATPRRCGGGWTWWLQRPWGNSKRRKWRAVGWVTLSSTPGMTAGWTLSYTVVAFTKQTMRLLRRGTEAVFPRAAHGAFGEPRVEIILVAVQHVDYSLRCEQIRNFVRQASFLYGNGHSLWWKKVWGGCGETCQATPGPWEMPPDWLKVNPESTTSVVWHLDLFMCSRIDCLYIIYIYIKLY